MLARHLNRWGDIVKFYSGVALLARIDESVEQRTLPCLSVYTHGFSKATKDSRCRQILPIMILEAGAHKKSNCAGREPKPKLTWSIERRQPFGNCLNLTGLKVTAHAPSNMATERAAPLPAGRAQGLLVGEPAVKRSTD